MFEEWKKKREEKKLKKDLKRILNASMSGGYMMSLSDFIRDPEEDHEEEGGA